MALVLPQSRTCPPFRLLNHWLETLLLLNGTLQQVPLKLLKSLVLMVHIGISRSFVHYGEDHEETDKNERHAGEEAPMAEAVVNLPFQDRDQATTFCLIGSSRC